MDGPQDTPEIVFTFTALDPATGADAEAEFGKDNVSASKRMTGEMPYSVFIKPLLDVFRKLLAWRSRQAEKIADAKIVIGTTEITLDGYTADDAEQLLNSKGLQQALTKLQR